MRAARCELCMADVSGEKCVFAVYRRVIDGKEHFFCCEGHAEEFERRAGRRGQR